MQIKSGFMALGVMATLVLLNGPTTHAKSQVTDKTEDKPVVVKVKSGDTLSAIAIEHDTSYVRLFNANESIENPDVIDVDDKVRIPTKDEKLKNRMADLPAQTQVAMTSSAAAGSYVAQTTAPSSARGSSTGNTYGAGWCTWWAKEMRPDLPNNLGDAGSWAANARAQGFTVNSSPSAGAIGVMSGHVAYVESVKGGMVSISEMGWNYTAGQSNRRTVPASTFHSYIH